MEKIVRTLFSPQNVNVKTNKIRANAYRPPSDKDEISVNRLDYTSANFCKYLGKKMTRNKNEFCGFGMHLVNEIESAKCSIVFTPIKAGEFKNPFHSDIKIGYVPEKGIPLPAEFNYKKEKLTETARLFIDPNPNLSNWTGEEIK